ncbi:MAG: hypothetical protein IT382_16960 [Deltaproteobacteria bacterium]|nr:hypothetical protein [Deltaproteobacteria bacterium]
MLVRDAVRTLQGGQAEMLKDTKPVKFYREKAEALAEECRVLRKEKAEHDALVASLRGDFGAAVDSLARMADDATSARTAQADAEEKCAGLNRGIEALQSKLKLARGRCDVLETEMLTVEASRDQWRSWCEEARSDVARLTKRVAELEADDRDLGALRRRLATKQAENDKLLTEVHRLKAAIRAQQAGFDVIKTTKADEANAAALIAMAKPSDDDGPRAALLSGLETPDFLKPAAEVTHAG